MRILASALATAMIVSTSVFVSAENAAAATDQSFYGVPPATTGSCTSKKMEIATGSSEQTTTSTSFTQLGDGGSITFQQKKTGCVTGTFFGNAGNTTAGDNMHLTVLLDGSICAPLSNNSVFANSGVDFSSHAIAFFCGTSVAPGTHTIQVDWAAGVGGEAAIFEHVLEVNHL